MDMNTHAIDLVTVNGTPLRFVYFPDEDVIRYYDRRYPLQPDELGYSIAHGNENGQGCGPYLMPQDFIGGPLRSIRGWHGVEAWDIDQFTRDIVGVWLIRIKAVINRANTAS